MAGAGRKELLCEQNPFELTGIDFVWVNPADHRQLAVFFVVEPDALVRPVDTTATEFTATITGSDDESDIPVAAHSWDVRNDASGNPRLTLTVFAEREGGFQTYRLALTDTPGDAGDSRLDPFCDEIAFSFKQPCPSPFDCRVEKECPDVENIDYPVDYLARDFESFRNALLAYSDDLYPDWDAQVPADFGGMVSELFAALGDEFSYIQDRFQREGYLSTLSERRSFARLARLVDYTLDPGTAASGLVVMRTYTGQERPLGVAPNLFAVPSGARVWADQIDRTPLPFEVGGTVAEMIAGDPLFPVHTHWTDLPVYVPDPQEPCLPIGAREIFIADGGLLTAPFPADVLAADISGYWVEKRLLIETRPDQPDEPVRRHVVTIDEPVTSFNDPLTGAGPILRVHWREEDALPFEFDQTTAFASANLVPVRAGMAVPERFVTGATTDPTLALLPRSIERSGPVRGNRRPAIHIFTLSATVRNGLGWSDETDGAGVVSHRPDVDLVQIDPDANGATVANWTVGTDPLDFAETDEAVGIEPGHYAPVARFERNGRRIAHTDYVSSAGYTLRFGAGVFGRAPVEGDVYDVVYRTGLGQAANVPDETITRLDEPSGQPAPLRTLPGEILSVSNPFAFTNGRDLQSLELARRIAPAAYKAITYRAVRNADYREQAERLDWVQQANAVTRCTGSWVSTFVSADPAGAFEISEERFEELSGRLSAVRQTGRCVIARQPVFQPIDLKIAICVESGFAFGDLVKRIGKALSPRTGGFFHPDRFTFGVPLRRPALEAAVACVPGVRAVLAIKIRRRGITGYRLFDTPELPVADNRILKVENNPNHPGEGSIRIYRDRIPELEGA